MLMIITDRHTNTDAAQLHLPEFTDAPRKQRERAARREYKEWLGEERDPYTYEYRIERP